MLIDSRLKEDMFRRFEPLTAEGVKNFPLETRFEIPSNIAPTTFVARWRDSLLSLERFRWHVNGKQGPLPDGTGTLIDLEKLAKLEKPRKLYQLSVEQDPITGRWYCWFRQRASTGKVPKKLDYGVAEVTGVAPSTQRNIPWVNPTDEEIRALCVLLHSRRIEGPFFLLRQLPEELLNEFNLSFDVAITWDEEKKLTMVI